MQWRIRYTVAVGYSDYNLSLSYYMNLCDAGLHGFKPQQQAQIMGTARPNSPQRAADPPIEHLGGMKVSILNPTET